MTISGAARGLAVTVALMTGVAAAQAEGCRAAKTQADLDECAGADFATADAALNATFKAVTDRLHGDTETKTLLVAAQKAWLAFRDDECAFEAASSIGGSIHPMIVAGCQATLTRARTDELRHLLTCGEGDMSCPLPPK